MKKQKQHRVVLLFLSYNETIILGSDNCIDYLQRFQRIPIFTIFMTLQIIF